MRGEIDLNIHARSGERSNAMLTPEQSNWIFNEPRNSATITTRQILRDRQPILLVARTADDGTWQFLTGGTFSTEDALLVSLETLVKHDPTLSDVADLPPGWVAERDSVGGEWRRAKDDDDEH